MTQETLKNQFLKTEPDFRIVPVYHPDSPYLDVFVSSDVIAPSMITYHNAPELPEREHYTSYLRPGPVNDFKALCVLPGEVYRDDVKLDPSAYQLRSVLLKIEIEPGHHEIGIVKFDPINFFISPDSSPFIFWTGSHLENPAGFEIDYPHNPPTIHPMITEIRLSVMYSMVNGIIMINVDDTHPRFKILGLEIWGGLVIVPSFTGVENGPA